MNENRLHRRMAQRRYETLRNQQLGFVYSGLIAIAMLTIITIII